MPHLVGAVLLDAIAHRLEVPFHQILHERHQRHLRRLIVIAAIRRHLVLLEDVPVGDGHVDQQVDELLPVKPRSRLHLLQHAHELHQRVLARHALALAQLVHLLLRARQRDDLLLVVAECLQLLVLVDDVAQLAAVVV